MAEIKISDLSIGDWVYHDDLVFGREIAKIHRLNKDKNRETIGITVHRSDGAFGVVGYISTSPTHGNLHPIPLTPEILEKNGWSRKKDYGWYLFYDRDIRVNIWFDKCRWDIEISSEDGKVTYADITGRGTLHTHQLQHALRLAGVEKDIEL